jgi:hypothetical protein
MGERADERQSDKTEKAKAATSEARTVSSALTRTGSIAYSGARNRVGSVSTMLSDICRRSTSADRHAVDASLPEVEPDAGKNLDTLAEATSLEPALGRPHLKALLNSEDLTPSRKDAKIEIRSQSGRAREESGLTVFRPPSFASLREIFFRSFRHLGVIGLSLRDRGINGLTPECGI